MTPDITTIKNALQARCEDVVHHLLPGAVQRGNYFHAGSVNGEPGKSLSVCINGARRGLWMDGANADHKGDLMDLWCAVRGKRLRDCLPDIREYLGIQPTPRIASRRQYTPPAPSALAHLRAAHSLVRDYLVKERKLTPAVIAQFRVSEKPGKPGTMAFPYYDENDELQMVKFIDIQRDAKGKKIVSVTAGAKPILFGMHTPLVVNASHLLICEGEIDAMSWQTAGIPAVSVPFGAKGESSDGSSPNDEWIENCFDFLNDYKTIYLSFDQDVEGQAAAAAVVKRLGMDRCKLVKLPYKDANECLLNQADLKAAFNAATDTGPDNFVSATDLMDRVIGVMAGGDRKLHGIQIFDWPFEFRLRPREGTIVTGFNGHGKSNFCYCLFAWLACVHGKRCFIGSYEEPIEQILTIMCNQAAGRLIDPLDDIDLLNTLRDRLMANIFVHDYEGTVPVKEYFDMAEYAVRRFGVEFVMLDSATCTDINLEEKAHVDSFAKDCQAFWKRTGSHLFVIAHPRKGLNEQIPPGKMDVKGSGGLTDLFFNVVTVHRSQHEVGSGQVIVSKQKVGGQLPQHNIYHHAQSSRVMFAPVAYGEPVQPWITDSF